MLLLTTEINVQATSFVLLWLLWVKPSLVREDTANPSLVAQNSSLFFDLTEKIGKTETVLITHARITKTLEASDKTSWTEPKTFGKPSKTPQASEIMVSIIIFVSTTITASKVVISVSPDCAAQNVVKAEYVFAMPTVRKITVCFSSALKAE